MTEQTVGGFRDRLLAGETLVGTWVKTPAMAIVEVLALSGLDVACLDAEHAPFDRRDLDACLLGGRQ
ncbi:MAG: aldolase, partial [Pseudomonadota bacterium]